MRGYRAFHMALRGAAFLLAVVVLVGGLHGCSSEDSKEEKAKAPPGGVLLRGAGATFPSWLYKRWFEVYHDDYPKTVITYDSVGSGEGIRRFIGKNVKEEEQVDFGASDAAMKDDEIASVPRGVVLLPVTAGSVVLAFNLPDFQGELKLSRKAYAGIFSGEIKNWNDPLIARTNPGMKLPKLTINTVVRQDGSGTTYAFTRHLDAIDETWHSRHGAGTLISWPGSAMRAKGNEGVAGRIKQAVGSIGYVSYEFAHQLGLKLAVLENKEGSLLHQQKRALQPHWPRRRCPRTCAFSFLTPQGRIPTLSSPLAGFCSTRTTRTPKRQSLSATCSSGACWKARSMLPDSAMCSCRRM